MIALPFIVFSLWLIISYHNRGITVGLYMILLFWLTSVGTIIIDINNYYYVYCAKTDLGVIAPLLYCSLLSWCIYPFTRLDIKKPNKQKELKGQNLLLAIYLFVFIVILIVSFTRINEILFNESLASVRNTLYTGEAVSFYDHLSGFPRYVCAISSVLSPSSYIMCFLFVYSLSFLKNKWWINMLYIISSLSPILISINIADRSQIIYWFIIMGLSIFWFKNSMEAKTLRKISISMAIFGGLLIVYFVMVTVSRFEMRDAGTTGGLFVYLGQNYINFCNNLNYAEPGFWFGQLFPIANKYIFDFTDRLFFHKLNFLK